MGMMFSCVFLEHTKIPISVFMLYYLIKKIFLQPKICLQWDLNLQLIAGETNALFTELFWHALVRGSLNGRLSMHHMTLWMVSELFVAKKG